MYMTELKIPVRGTEKDMEETKMCITELEIQVRGKTLSYIHETLGSVLRLQVKEVKCKFKNAH